MAGGLGLGGKVMAGGLGLTGEVGGGHDAAAHTGDGLDAVARKLPSDGPRSLTVAPEVEPKPSQA